MKKLIYWIPSILWMGVIYYSSDQPYQDQDIKPLLSNYVDLSFLEPIFQSISFTYNQSLVNVEQLGVEGFIEFFIRKGAHVGVFFLLCILLYVAATKTFTNKSRNIPLLVAFFVTVLYALFDEWHQGLTPNRTPYIGDVFLDSFGALLAIVVILITLNVKDKLQK